MNKYQQSELLTSVAKALPSGCQLPKISFDGRSEWELSNDSGVGYGLTLEEALHAWCENAKAMCQLNYGEGVSWEPVFKLLEPYAPPIDTTYPITFSETGL